MVPGVAGSIPVRHPGGVGLGMVGSTLQVESGRCRSVAQLVEHRSPKPAVAGSIPAGPVWRVVGRVGMRACLAGRTDRILALSSRGLGHGPLKAGTRVRIPLALWWVRVQLEVFTVGGVGRFWPCGAFVYRLGRDPFKVQRRVRLPYALSVVWVGLQVRDWEQGTGAVAQSVRVPHCHCGGRGFEPRRPRSAGCRIASGTGERGLPWW